jgi:chemotaxis protein MotB
VTRKKRRPGSFSHDRWLVSYADFIALLFAFFVVMYASAQVDKRRAGRLAMAIQVAFQELGVFDSSNTQIPIQDQNAMPFQTVQTVENAERAADLKRIVNPMKGTVTTSAEAQSLQEAQSAIEKALAPEIRRNAVSMTMRREGLVISLKEMGFFDSASPTIRPDAMGAITRLAAILRDRPENLRIEGHTDNLPIHNAKFASNWELSTARATEMIILLIMHYGLPPNRLSAAGYAEFHPTATNSTPEGRAQNRRLDIVILAPTRADELIADSPKSAQPPLHSPAPDPSRSAVPQGHP